MVLILINFKTKEQMWIPITKEIPEYDPNHQPAFSIFIKASNERYYSGYSITEYSITTFYQYNGRKILNVSHWMKIPK